METTLTVLLVMLLVISLLALVFFGGFKSLRGDPLPAEPSSSESADNGEANVT